jgi:hypothetical protein
MLLAATSLSLLVNLPARAADAPAPGPAAANQAAPAPVAVSPQATELARIMVPKEEWSRFMELIAKDTQRQMQGHPGSKLTFPADFDARVRAEVEKVLPYEDLIGMHARELSAVYTEKELTDLVAFQKSPLGQKYRTASVQEGDRVVAQTQQRFGEKMPGVMQRLAAGLQQPAPKKAESKPAEAKPSK